MRVRVHVSHGRSIARGGHGGRRLSPAVPEETPQRRLRTGGRNGPSLGQSRARPWPRRVVPASSHRQVRSPHQRTNTGLLCRCLHRLHQSERHEFRAYAMRLPQQWQLLSGLRSLLAPQWFPTSSWPLPNAGELPLETVFGFGQAPQETLELGVSKIAWIQPVQARSANGPTCDQTIKLESSDRPLYDRERNFENPRKLTRVAFPQHLEGKQNPRTRLGPEGTGLRIDLH